MYRRNCYLTTLAGLLRTSARRLEERIGIRDRDELGTDGYIAWLFATAGLPILQRFVFYDRDHLLHFLQQSPRTVCSRPVAVALSYRITGNFHMIGLWVRRNCETNQVAIELIDWQMSKNDTRRRTHQLPNANEYYINDTYGLY